ENEPGRGQTVFCRGRPPDRGACPLPEAALSPCDGSRRRCGPHHRRFFAGDLHPVVCRLRAAFIGALSSVRAAATSRLRSPPAQEVRCGSQVRISSISSTGRSGMIAKMRMLRHLARRAVCHGAPGYATTLTIVLCVAVLLLCEFAAHADGSAQLLSIERQRRWEI